MPLLALPAPIPPWLVLPFFGLLSAIAVAPVLVPTFWHRHYKAIAAVLGVAMLGYYGLIRHDWHTPAETLAEYASFATLLTALYVVGGSLFVNLNVVATPGRNVALLGVGAVLAALVGTTGAAVLLIRSFIRLNDERAQAYHVAFFIFIVANAGGLLTPLGDPPLFLGYLRGVPFSWTLRTLWLPWLLTNGLLVLLFWLRDRRTPFPGRLSAAEERRKQRAGGRLPAITFRGWPNLIGLAVVVGTVLLDPTRVPGLPTLHLAPGVDVSFVRELLQAGAAWACWRGTPHKTLQANHFTWEPIREVVFLFFGIFLTMMPALQAARAVVAQPQLAGLLQPGVLYWSTGLLSAFLDNAPTYATFTALAMSRHGLDYHQSAHVLRFATDPATLPLLRAIATSAVLFGALTYIGNGPNLLVRAVAEKEGVPMPSFFGYIGRFAIPYLLPVLGIVSGLLLLLNRAVE